MKGEDEGMQVDMQAQEVGPTAEEVGVMDAPGAALVLLGEATGGVGQMAPEQSGVPQALAAPP